MHIKNNENSMKQHEIVQCKKERQDENVLNLS